MIPDKIYLNEDGYGVQTVWSTYPSDIRSSHEYIRKDTLIEWAKQKQYESLTIVADNFWQEAIDKISSM